MKPPLPKPLEITEVNWLPIARSFIERIELQSTIDRLVPNEMRISVSQVVTGLVLDALSGRTPLFRLQDSLTEQTAEVLLGQAVAAETFADHNVGRVLDKLFEAGTSKIFSEIAQKAVQVFEIDPSHVHADTTSVSLYGDYDCIEPPFRIEHGHSKDKRPDLKQFIVSLLCVEGNIPIFCKHEDGAASDKTINNRLLTDISSHMARHGLGEGAFVYIADSALITGPNLEKMANTLYLSRLPANFSECGRVIREAVEANRWSEIGTLNESSASTKRPAAYYRAYESTVTIEGKAYRAVVIHSSAHDKRRHKRIDRAVEKERKELEKLARDVRATPFYCRPDAEKEADRLSRLGTYHRVRAEITEIPRFGRGRPAKDQPRVPSRIEYGVTLRIEEDPEKLKGPRMEAGCFVLITNIPEAHEEIGPAEGLMRLYKEQIGIERDFGFLKDPAIVNAIFLKNPSRIEALGLILVIALLIWRLIERTLRQYVNETGKTLPGWDGKRTDRPTSFMMTTKFVKVFVCKIDGQRTLGQPLTSQQLEYLKALGLTPRVFTDP